MSSENHRAGREDMKSWDEILDRRVKDGYIFYGSGHSWIPTHPERLPLPES